MFGITKKCSYHKIIVTELTVKPFLASLLSSIVMTLSPKEREGSRSTDLVSFRTISWLRTPSNEETLRTLKLLLVDGEGV